MRIERTFTLGEHTIRLETGELARQATGAVLLEQAGTVVLATVVAAAEPKSGQSFFPLTVDYVEKTYAAGRIPHGRDRREGMATEREVLVSRLIDRSIRPLFPKNFRHEVHVVIHVLSVNPAIHPDVPTLLATAAALRLSGLPFDGPLAAVRMGRAEGRVLCHPDRAARNGSSLDLLVAANRVGIVMVEAEVDNLDEAILLSALQAAQEALQPAFDAMDSLAAAVRPSWTQRPAEPLPHEPAATLAQVAEIAESSLHSAYQFAAGSARALAVESLRRHVLQTLAACDPPLDGPMVEDALEVLERRVVRARILAGDTRIDGRSATQIRPLEMRTGVLPRTHGSALFTRGETQVLATATLGNERDGQLIEAIDGSRIDRFLLHYNMPPFATGETGRMGGSKRRELGHGRLAKRALIAVLPDAEVFPYVVRVVSEVTESNGSSSMASVCGACLAMVDAGVPLKQLAAGIAMGLVVDGPRYAVLTDILGNEDHIGDMDLKVAGTDTGITALQMDVKVPGVALEVLAAALTQAGAARREILQAMHAAVGDTPRDLPQHAPGLLTMCIDTDLIGEVIGRQGATVRTIADATGAAIDVADGGRITIRADSMAAAGEAQSRIEEVLRNAVVVGRVYDAIVVEVIEFFGVHVELRPGRLGLLHDTRMHGATAAGQAGRPGLGETVRVQVVGRNRDGFFETTMVPTEQSDVDVDLATATPTAA